MNNHRDDWVYYSKLYVIRVMGIILPPGALIIVSGITAVIGFLMYRPVRPGCIRGHVCSCTSSTRVLHSWLDMKRYVSACLTVYATTTKLSLLYDGVRDLSKATDTMNSGED